jgi:hypothetical protein
MGGVELMKTVAIILTALALMGAWTGTFWTGDTFPESLRPTVVPWASGCYIVDGGIVLDIRVTDRGAVYKTVVPFTQ